MKKNIIGIIGGMGPQASVEFYRMLIDKAQRCYGSCKNDKYPEILIDSVPVPDFISNTDRKKEAVIILEDRVRRISRFGATSIGIVCNTAHLLFSRLQSQTSVPMISMIDEVVNKIDKHGKAVLLLATPTTLQTELYQTALKQAHIQYVVPHDKDYEILESIIRGVLAGFERKQLTDSLVTLVESYVKQDTIGGIVLGCTELPLVFPKNYRLPVYNSLSILADILLEKYYALKGGE